MLYCVNEDKSTFLVSVAWSDNDFRDASIMRPQTEQKMCVISGAKAKLCALAPWVGKWNYLQEQGESLGAACQPPALRDSSAAAGGSRPKARWDDGGLGRCPGAQIAAGADAPATYTPTLGPGRGHCKCLPPPPEWTDGTFPPLWLNGAGS